jgi:hypothetical protein
MFPRSAFAFPLMIVDDLDIETMAIAPNKTDAPLIVDANRMLTFAIAAQRFQLVSGRRCQNAQFGCGVQMKQLSQSDTFKGSKASALLVVKEFFRIS